jgi:putative DNA primase/helicase
MTTKIQISDLLKDDAGRMHLVFDYTDVGGEQRHLIIPRGQILEPRRIVSRLLDEGAQLQREEAVADVQAAIDNAPKAPTGLLVNRHGWHGEGEEKVYVTNNEVFGDSSLPIFYVPLIDDDPAFGASGGTLEDWQDGLREPFAESAYLTFVTSLAFGATLLEPLGAEGGTFSLVGETTTFKTTTARAGQSVFGRAEPNDLASLDVTKRGREELCASRCDSVLVLDETARLDKSFSSADERELAHCIASGRAKIRSASVARNTLLSNVTWRVFALLTSEHRFETKGLKHGAALRLAQIPVFDANLGGVFDRTGLQGSARLARALELAGQVGDCIGANYGVAGPAFVTAFLADRQALVERAEVLIDHFIGQVGVKGNAQQERFAHKFAVAYAAGVIAAEEGIAPWDSRHVGRCVASVYQLARRAMGGGEEQSPAILNRIAQAIRAGRFPLVRKGEALPSCEARIWGVRRDVGEERVFALPLSEVDRLAGTAGAARDLVAYWAENDLLLLSPDGKNTRQLQVTGWSDQRQRLVCLKRSAFQVSGRAN